MDSTPMYDTIMSLPLFKGVSRERISYFLEKTSISFLKYKSGDIILRHDDEITKLRFVISGKIKVINTCKDGLIKISEVRGKGCVIGADRLFGMHTKSGCDVAAADNTGIMEFSKEQYLNLINADSINLLNFLNFISLKVQNAYVAVSDLCGCSFSVFLARIVKLYTQRHSERITIEIDKKYIERMQLTLRDKFESDINILSTSGAIKRDGNVFDIIDRELLIEYGGLDF